MSAREDASEAHEAHGHAWGPWITTGLTMHRACRSWDCGEVEGRHTHKGSPRADRDPVSPTERAAALRARIAADRLRGRCIPCTWALDEEHNPADPTCDGPR